MPPPLSPEESRRAFRTKPGKRVELVVAEPMIESPVAIDFGADGKLWVCEMRDYPTGLDGNFKPGGVIKVLEDRDGDGRYDRATAFLEGLPFPTGVMAWRKGALRPHLRRARDHLRRGHRRRRPGRRPPHPVPGLLDRELPGARQRPLVRPG
jgi:hypothetical protein